MTGELAALAAAIAFGLSTVFARRFMVAVAPEAGVLVSIAMNVVVFALLALGAAARGDLPRVHAAAVMLFIAGGVTATGVGRNLSYLGIERVGPSRVSVVRLSQTVFTLASGLFFLRELPRPWQLGGLAVVTAGLWVSLQPGGRGHDTSSTPRRTHLAGVMMAFGSAAAFALGDTARRMGLMLTPSPALAAVVGASAAMAAHLAWSIPRRSARWPGASGLRCLDLWLSAMCNTVAILLLYVGLRHAPVAIVSVLYNLQVLIVLLVSPLILRGEEQIGARLLAGSILALAGTALILLG